MKSKVHGKNGSIHCFLGYFLADFHVFRMPALVGKKAVAVGRAKKKQNNKLECFFFVVCWPFLFYRLFFFCLLLPFWLKQTKVLRPMATDGVDERPATGCR